MPYWRSTWLIDTVENANIQYTILVLELVRQIWPHRVRNVTTEDWNLSGCQLIWGTVIGDRKLTASGQNAKNKFPPQSVSDCGGNHDDWWDNLHHVHICTMYMMYSRSRGHTNYYSYHGCYYLLYLFLHVKQPCWLDFLPATLFTCNHGNHHDHCNVFVNMLK